MGQYDAYRRIGKVERVERVEKNDKTEALDLQRKAKFEGAMARAADAIRQADQRRRHHSFDDAQQRLVPSKKK